MAWPFLEEISKNYLNVNNAYVSHRHDTETPSQ